MGKIEKKKFCKILTRRKHAPSKWNVKISLTHPDCF